MTNKDIASQLKLIGQLKELHREDPFRAKAYYNASFQVSRFTQPLIEMSEDDILRFPKIGKGLAQKIHRALKDGFFIDLETYLSITPSSVLEMLSIKNMGPSKLKVLWKEHNITTTDALLTLCEENKLAAISGFGAKTQDAIKASILFSKQNEGKILLASALQITNQLQHDILQDIDPNLFCIVGQMAMQNNIIDHIEFITSSTQIKSLVEDYVHTHVLAVKTTVYLVEKADFSYEKFMRSSSQAHVKMLDHIPPKKEWVSSEDLYKKNKMPYIILPMRNGKDEFKWGKKYSPEQVVSFSDLKGALHNHSTYSDGQHTLKDMADASKALGLHYFGIADHSKTAVYANGLSIARLEKQIIEIDQLNTGYTDFQVLKGTESDILGDGSLDYPSDVLDRLDYVVASIHNGFNMSKEKATQRLIKAIEHPNTSILGHLSGRLLLRRKSYELDYEKITDACISNKVAIEINANPNRLDIDWSYIFKAMDKGAYFSINSDAHHKDSLSDMQYGVYSAQKAGLIKQRVINSFALNDLMLFFKK